jgi:hypothetical protein
MLRFLGVYMRVVVDVSINATFMLTTLDSTFAGCCVSDMISVGNSRWGVKGKSVHLETGHMQGPCAHGHLIAFCALVTLSVIYDQNVA